jgi:hypothetical protein
MPDVAGTTPSTRLQEPTVTTATSTRTHQSDTLETALGLALLWFVPVVAFVVALLLG